MFSSPFPEFISFFCEHLSDSTDFLLHPEEEKISASFGSSKRRAEFSLGRYCARRALSNLELETVPILRNTESREPYWPKSVRGSITHSEGFAAAAVGLTKDVSGIGIDLESLSRVVDFNIGDMSVWIKNGSSWSLYLLSRQTVIFELYFRLKSQSSNAFSRSHKPTFIFRMQK